jgi:hypothetical protein
MIPTSTFTFLETQTKKLCSQLKEFSALSGSDDALLEECELLSRDRDEQVNRLAVRDSLALNKSKGPVPRQVRCLLFLDATALNRWHGVSPHVCLNNYVT